MPDRETLEFENELDQEMERVTQIGESAHTMTEVAMCMSEVDRLAYLKCWSHILSDPDWQAWLKKIQNPDCEGPLELIQHDDWCEARGTGHLRIWTEKIDG